MITIKLGLLLGINVKQTTEKRKGKKRKKKKNKKSKRSKSSKSSRASNKSRREPPPTFDYQYEVGTPTGFIHIDYALIPDNPSYSVDVVYWSNIAKIFTADGTVAYRPLLRDDVMWVPIMMEHKFKELEEEALLRLHSYAIYFVFSDKKKKLGNRAKSERGKKSFFIKEENVKMDGIFEAYEYNPNKMENCITGLLKDEMTSIPSATKLLVFENSILYPKMLSILRRLEANHQVHCKLFVPVSPEPPADAIKNYVDDSLKFLQETPMPRKKAKKGKIKKSKKSTKDKASQKSRKKKKVRDKKEHKTGDTVLKVAAETFLTDPILSIYGLQCPRGRLERVFALFSVSGLLTKELNAKLTPFVIKLKTIKNLPVGVLLENRIHSVFLRYNINHIAQAQTLSKSLSKRIIVDESHVYFRPPADRMIEFLQSQRLRVELVGNYIKPNEVAKLFGTLKTDYDPKKITDPNLYLEESSTTIILAAACYDLSLLLKNVYNLEMTNSFRNPNHPLVQPNVNMYRNLEYSRRTNINEMNLMASGCTQSTSPLTDAILLDYGTCLKIEVYIGAPIYGLTSLLTRTDLYKRMLLVIYDDEIAKVLLNEIMLHNQNLTIELGTTNYYRYNDRSVEPHMDMLTGFVIDNGNSYIFCLEGTTPNYALEVIWSQIQKFNEPICKIHYNSEFVFHDRIYACFMKLGGVYQIFLRDQLQDIFKLYDVYLTSHIPRLCLKALQKLELLMRTPTFKEANQSVLFPTVDEIFSLVMEFGISFRIT